MNPCIQGSKTGSFMVAANLSSLSGGRLAFFGGSFDPPHRGHLAVAHAAKTALALDTVLFAPVGSQPLKPFGSTATFEDRVAMTTLAIANHPGFAISLTDAPVPGNAPNYTIDTLQTLRTQLPADGALFCLMGADSFLSLRKWFRGAEIPFAASLIVASRPGQSLDELTNILPTGISIDDQPVSISQQSGVDVRICTLRSALGASALFYLLPGLHVEISASDIRRQVRSAAGHRTEGSELLPDAVARYIAQHKLYT